MANNVLMQVRDLSKAYGDKIIFHEANISIVEKQKIGVIGRNGAGKSTLFKMIMGLEEADSGEIQHFPELQLGYIPQNDPFTPDEIVLEFLVRYTGKAEWECSKVAGQFQLKNEILAKKIGDLSGGYQMRVKLAATLLFEPNLLLLDEPTNFLDLSTLILLEQFLKNFRGGFLCITHDREFLKKTCTSTMEVEAGGIVLHPEPLEEYLEFKKEQVELAKTVNKNIEKKQEQLQTFVNRFGAKASMAASAQSKMKQISKMENQKIGIGNHISSVKMLIPTVATRAGVALTIEDLTIGYIMPDPADTTQMVERKIAEKINLEIDKGKKVAILGDNGQGKSTLLKTIADKLPSLAGKMRWSNGLKVAYYAQHVSLALDPDLTVAEYLKKVASGEVKDEEINRMMGNFLFKKNDTTKPIRVLSGGEKGRLCLAGMFLTKSDVLLLDEPTNHLDFETVEAMGEALGKFNGTVVVVSHDRTFVNLIANEIWEVNNGQVKRVLGTYEDYVWHKEQLAEAETKLEAKNSSASNSGPFDDLDKPKPALDKAERIRQYELRKELGKVEKKIEQLKAKIAENVNDFKSIEELEAKEIRWLEINEELV